MAAQEVESGKGGRPRLLTPELHQRIKQTFLLGAYATDVAAMHKVSVRTHHHWMNLGHKYEEALDAGEPVDASHAMYYDYMIDCEAARAEARVVAVMAVSKQIREPGTYLPGWRAAVEFLRRTDPEHWDQLGAHRIELTGKEGGPVQFEVTELEQRLSSSLSGALPRLREIEGAEEDILDAEVVDDALSYRQESGSWVPPPWVAGMASTADDDGLDYAYAAWSGARQAT